MNISRLLICLFVFTCALTLAQDFGFTKQTTVPGTHLSLVPPAGFVKSDKFAGFTYPGYATSLIVVEMKAPFSEVAKAFTSKQAVEKGNMKYLGHERTAFCGMPAVLAKTSQRSNGVDLIKWILVSGNDNLSLMFVGVFPQKLSGQFSELIKQTMLNAKWDINRRVDHFASLPYTIDLNAGFSPCLNMEKALILTPSGVKPDKTPDRAVYMVIAVEENFAAKGSTENFIKKNIPALIKAPTYTVTQKQRMKINGIEVYSLDVECVKSNMPTFATFIFLFKGNDCFITMGSCNQNAKQKYIGSFVKMNESLTLKDK